MASDCDMWGERRRIIFLFGATRPTFTRRDRSYLCRLHCVLPQFYDGVSAIDAGSSLRKPVSMWPGMYHSPVTYALWQARSIFDTPSTTGVDSITAETPSLSRTTIRYPFSSDYILREQYRNPWNGIRVGNLLEVSIRWVCTCRYLLPLPV
ncbi:hypothetical protein L2E82_34562 [Cichorium intybus]|uniref:Uncharacterized protein n=1 Tax=Cichorium intybus TaxID=13427 RepID=A0ACB9BMB0_CICIN|nr:hypothetical protein L2E82_34562 [Cichorium intybus]